MFIRALYLLYSVNEELLFSWFEESCQDVTVRLLIFQLNDEIEAFFLLETSILNWNNLIVGFMFYVLGFLLLQIMHWIRCYFLII